MGPQRRARAGQLLRGDQGFRLSLGRRVHGAPGWQVFLAAVYHCALVAAARGTTTDAFMEVFGRSAAAAEVAGALAELPEGAIF